MIHTLTPFYDILHRLQEHIFTSIYFTFVLLLNKYFPQDTRNPRHANMGKYCVFDLVERCGTLNLYSLMLHSLLDWSVTRKGTIKECKFHLCSRSSSSSTSSSTLSSTLSLLWKPSDSPLSLLHPIKAIHC